jgi:multiple sugar transport system substrate-binding protein
MKKVLSFLLVLMLGLSCLSFAAADETTTITLWHRWSGANETILNQCVEEFMAENPDIKIEVVAKAGEYFELLQSMIADAAAGNDKPDVFVGGYNLLNYIAEELEPTTVDELAPSADALAELYDRFTPEMLALANYDGAQIGLPLAVSNMVMYCNMDIFEAAGLTEEDIPTTYEQAMEVSQIIKDKTGKYGFFMQLPDNWGDQAIIFSAGGELLSEDKTRVDFTNEGIILALQTWQDMYNKGYAPVCTNNEGVAMFNSGDVAMFQTSIMSIHAYEEYVSNMVVAECLGFEGKTKQLPAGGAAMISFSTKDEKKAAAYRFFDFMTSQKGMEMFTTTGYLCVTKAEVPVTPGQEAAYAQTQYARAWECWPGGSAGLEIDSLWISTRNSIIMENKDVVSTLAALSEECNEILDNQ